MRKQNLVAVVNDEIMMVGKGMLTCHFEDEFNDLIEKISDAITAHVTNDERFVSALGRKKAKKTRFEVLPICFECDDCGALQYTMHVVMIVDGEETDFYYEYTLMSNPVAEELEFAPVVLYNNGGKSHLMQVFESECSGVTSVETLKNGRGENDSDDYVERIFAEILSEADLKVF